MYLEKFCLSSLLHLNLLLQLLQSGSNLTQNPKIKQNYNLPLGLILPGSFFFFFNLVHSFDQILKPFPFKREGKEITSQGLTLPYVHSTQG